MAPRRTRGEWAAGATTDELLLAFKWELAQALKQPFIDCNSNYNQQKKVTFLRDYSEIIPLPLLRNAAIDALAPPAQRKCVAVARALRRLPPELAARVLRFADWPMAYGKALSPAQLHDLCKAHFLGALTSRGGKLTMAIPRDGDFPEKSAAVSAIIDSAWAQRAAWWKLFPPRRWAGRRGEVVQAPQPDCLAERIIAVEAAVSAVAVARTLTLPAPPTDSRRERHSIELMVKLIYNGEHRTSRSSKAVATMVVPDDASVTELDGWMCELDDSLGSWCYLRVTDLEQFDREREERIHRRAADWRRQYGHAVPGDEVERANDEYRPPSSVAARISRIQMGDMGLADVGASSLLQPSSAPFKTCAVLGSRKALLDHLCEEHGAPTKYPRHEDVSSWTFEHEDSPPFASADSVPVSAGYRSTVLDICEHVALADVLPMPEERTPLLRTYYSEGSRIQGLRTEIDWSRSANAYELFGLRRLPRLPDAEYPKIRRVSTVPRNPL